MLALIIIIVLAIIGTAALAVWIMDERGKIQSARRCMEICEDVNHSCDEINKVSPPLPDMTKTGVTFAEAAKNIQNACGQPYVEIDGVLVPGVRCNDCCRPFSLPDIKRLLDGRIFCKGCYDSRVERGLIVEPKLDGARYQYSLADTTDRETVEKLKAFVDDSISSPRKIEIVESGWHPLPMEELRKKVDK